MDEHEGRPLVLLHLGWRRDRELVAGLLAASGAQTVASPAGAELRRLLADGRLDLILADTKGGTGALDELLRSVDADAGGQELPVVLLAEAREMAGLAQLVLARPNAVLLAKPVDPGQLRAAVSAGLRYRAGRRRERDLILEVSHANEELRTADRKKDEFLAMLAHELRNPLSAIHGAVRVAQSPNAGAHLPQTLEIIERQARNLARLIDDLLDVARIAQGKVELKRETVEMTGVVNRAAQAARVLVEQKRHELSFRFEHRPMHVYGDPTRLEQIVGNLLTNAAKYTEPGGRIVVSAAVEGTEVVIKVRDNGVGIAIEMVPKIFMLFTQVVRSLARSEGGLGIGLALVKQLVEMHGGTISAASVVGEGSEFTVRLPKVQDGSTTKAKAERADDASGAGKRILIVDDNADTARLTGRLLRTLGFEVQLCHDGKEAIEVARQYRPHVVLLDIGLPGMDGFEVARRLREEDSCRDSLIVGVSGYGDEAARGKGREAGFDHHMVKPLDYDQFVSLIG